MLIIYIRKIEYEYDICYENKSLCGLHRQKEKYQKLRCKYWLVMGRENSARISMYILQAKMGIYHRCNLQLLKTKIT